MLAWFYHLWSVQCLIKMNKKPFIAWKFRRDRCNVYHVKLQFPSNQSVLAFLCEPRNVILKIKIVLLEFRINRVGILKCCPQPHIALWQESSPILKSVKVKDLPQLSRTLTKRIYPTLEKRIPQIHCEQFYPFYRPSKQISAAHNWSYPTEQTMVVTAFESRLRGHGFSSSWDPDVLFS